MFVGYKYNQREARYLEIIKKYSKQEIDTISQIFSNIFLLCSIEKKGDYYDYLGDLLMKSKVFSKELGQFFTPFSVSQLMSQMLFNTSKKDEEIIFLNEPTCGGGGMIIACAEYLESKGRNVQKKFLAILQDIMPRCVHITFIQLALMGIPAIILQGNTLTMEFIDEWHTPEFLNNYEEFNAFLKSKNLKV